MGIEPAFLLYGSYGYTGNLIAELAVQHGMPPMLAGRNESQLQNQAKRLGLDYRCFSLDNRSALEAALKEVPVVLHCAGPYIHTYQQMAEACLHTNTHYIDLSGEMAVYQGLVALDSAARLAGVMLLPGAGFDIVPSDCLAAHLKQRLPSANRLELAIQALGTGVSRGTALSAIQSLPRQGWVRRDGKLLTEPIAATSKMVDFGYGLKKVVSIPLADVFTAYYSTLIPNISGYFAIPPLLRMLLFANHQLNWMLAKKTLQNLLIRLIRLFLQGPSQSSRQRGRCLLWGMVADAEDNQAISLLETPEAYSLTAHTAIRVVAKTLARKSKPGFQTPSTAFGADFILEFAGVKRLDLPSHS